MVRIEDIRKEHELTQEEFGRLIGVSNVEVHNYEKGKRGLPIKIAKKIANKFRVKWYTLYENGESNYSNRGKSGSVGANGDR